MTTFSTKARKTNAKEIRAKAEKEAVASAGRQWSKEQQAIFKFCADKPGNLIVRARAGTGKTTTILEAIKHLGGTPLLCAFNKRIANELSEKVGDGAHVYTLHGLGFRFVKKGWPGVTVDDKRGMRLAERALRSVGKPPTKDWMISVSKLASMVKEICPYWAGTEPFDAIRAAYGCDEALPRAYDLDAYLRATAEALKLAEQEDGTVDFSDMLYIPLRHNMIYQCYDAVVVDEAQDMNKAQLEIAGKVLRDSGRIIVVGDDRQAIYGFRGADSGSIDRLKMAFKAKELSLTTTYRCPKLIVAEAAKLVPDYKAADTAPDGVIRRIPLSALANEAGPGDFVLSRTNAPLLSAILDMVRLGKRAKIEGRDIGKGLQGIIYKLKPQDPEELSQLIYEWAANGIARAGGNESRIQQVQDQADILHVLAQDEEVRTVQDIHNKIDSLFTDDENRSARVVCSTVHKAKGLEADRVFLLEDTFKLGAAAGGEEANINYVAITRAKKELIWVSSGKIK